MFICFMMTININILVNQQGIDISTLPPYNFTCICYFIYYIVISTIRSVKFIARLTKAAKWRKVRLKPVSVSIKVLMKCNYKSEKNEEAFIQFLWVSSCAYLSNSIPSAISRLSFCLPSERGASPRTPISNLQLQTKVIPSMWKPLLKFPRFS